MKWLATIPKCLHTYKEINETALQVRQTKLQNRRLLITYKVHRF
jgi:hypothetical protein